MFVCAVLSAFVCCVCVCAFVVVFVLRFCVLVCVEVHYVVVLCVTVLKFAFSAHIQFPHFSDESVFQDMTGTQAVYGNSGLKILHQQ